jgi:hypothetical protein
LQWVRCSGWRQPLQWSVAVGGDSRVAVERCSWWRQPRCSGALQWVETAAVAKCACMPSLACRGPLHPACDTACCLLCMLGAANIVHCRPAMQIGTSIICIGAVNIFLQLDPSRSRNHSELIGAGRRMQVKQVKLSLPALYHLGLQRHGIAYYHDSPTEARGFLSRRIMR